MSNLPSGEIPRGAIRFNTDSNKPELWDGSQWAEFQLSTPNLGRGSDTQPGARGIFAGGEVPSSPNRTDRIDYVNISSTGDATDFGNLIQAKRFAVGSASRTRGLFQSGGTVSVLINESDFITIASTGDAQDFGNLVISAHRRFAGSNQTRTIVAGTISPADTTAIDFATIASTGNYVDFGNLSEGRFGAAPLFNSTRGIFVSGCTNSAGTTFTNTIDFVTIATTGNAQDFADSPVILRESVGFANPVRGIYGTGFVTNNSTFNTNLRYITLSSSGQSTTFGDCSQTVEAYAGLASPTRGLYAGGSTPTVTNAINYVNIATEGDTVDFGDLTESRVGPGGLSNAHGGL